jgi:integrase
MIYRRGRIYYADLSIGKKRVRHSLHTTSKYIALDRTKELRDRLEGQLIEKKTTISAFFEQYITWAKSSKPGSADREEQRLGKIKAFLMGEGIEYLEDVTAFHVEQLKMLLKDKGLSTATVNRYLQLMRGLFYRAIDWQIYHKPNPLRHIRLFREDPKIHILTEAETAKIILAAKAISKNGKTSLQRNFGDLVLFGLNTGMRKSEILNLRWDDIKAEGARVAGKGGKVRIVPLNAAAMAICKKLKSESPFIFDIPNRRQKDLMRRTVEQIKRRIGIDFHFHLLRHFFTTSLVSRGVDVVTISEILGHSKTMTSLLYAHTEPERKKRAVDLLETIFNGTKSVTVAGNEGVED